MPANAASALITVTYPCPLPDGSLTATLRYVIVNPPNAIIDDFVAKCMVGDSGVVSLVSMLNSNTTANGTFSFASPTTGAVIESNDLRYQDPGCFSMRYTVPNPDGCANAIVQDDASLLITQAPKADFSFGAGVNDCFESGSDPRNVGVSVATSTYNGVTPVYEWEVTSTGGLNVFISGETTATPTILVDFNGAPEYSAGSLQVCLTETIPLPAIACGTNDPGNACTSSTCKTVSIVSLPDCDTDCPGIEGSTVCEVNTNPSIALNCSFLSINTPDIFFAEVGPADPNQSQAISCQTESFDIEYDAQFKIGDLDQSDLPSFGDLPLVSGICDLLQFCICVDLGFLGSIEIRPFSFIPSSFCDDDIVTFLLDAFGNGQGYQVWADTDGDGNFDMLIDEQNLGNLLTNTVPNNVPGQGKITVRILGSANGAPSGPCQDPAPPLNLLDILPIDAIPIVGPTITSILEFAGCGVNIGFSDVQDYEVFVYNDQPPAFVNCPSGYVFSDGPNCSAFVNWSAPVATDNCNNSVVTDVVQLTDASLWPVSIPNAPTLSSGQFVEYNPDGTNVYTVVYEATACNGITNHCSFSVTISPGEQPDLVCPPSLILGNDVDACTNVVTGISTLEGFGSCGAEVTWRAWEGTAAVPAPGDVFANGLNDASGTTFGLGTSTVEYTLNAPDQLGNPTTQTCVFTVTVEDSQLPVVSCQDLTVQLNNNGSVTVTAVQVDGGSSDNCGDVTLAVQKGTAGFGPSMMFDCSDVGSNTITLRVTDEEGNQRNCLAQVVVIDFFEGFEIDLDVPELCLEANNPVQLDFSNYLVITRPNGTVVPHAAVGTLGPNVGGYFAITAFWPAPGSGTQLGTSPADPKDIGYINPLTGVYTPGAGNGYVTITYLLTIGAQVSQIGALIEGCYELAHDVFELRQPLDMGSPECECLEGDERIVDLGVVSGGLEPYTIQYSGVRLDLDGDGIDEDNDGEYTYDVANGHNINDFTEDLGELRVVYTTAVWSFTIVDARGCEIFRSGSCDNDDLTEGPQITCPPSNNTLTTEALLCESQYDWTHPLPTDNCGVILYDYRIFNPDGSIDGPHNLNALLNTAPGAPLPDFFDATYEFQRGVSIIRYYAEDAQGNFITCTFQITVTDNDPPYFINCPYPPVVQNAEGSFCDAYVNFALPLAADNCDVPVVTQIDNTGLTTGDRFPVGTTIMYWEAIDLTGNRDTCQVKVIVNDFEHVPVLDCPGNVVQNNDLWECGAIVNNISPDFSSPCQDNLAVTYSIYSDAALTQRISCGVWDASGEFFEEGLSYVKYTVQNQPLLLITEVQQSGVSDRIEITNLGPADIDLNCLEVIRTSSNPAANQSLAPVSLLPSLAPSILTVGGVRIFNFTFNGAAGMPACYTIGYMGVVLDQVAVNGFAGCAGFGGTLASGDVIRICEDDSNNAADWVVAQLCQPLTFGSLNAELEAMPDNGTLTSLQSINPLESTCTFSVDIRDVEDPFCGKLTTSTTYNGPGINNLNAASCNRSTINIPNTGCIIGDIVLNINGTARPNNSKITLISPLGIKVNVTEVPDDSIAVLFAQKAAGLWTLDVVPNAGQSPTVISWSLQINCLDTFDLADQVLPNAPGQCGANFTWTHPLFVDNCFNGTISVAYTSADAECVPQSGIVLGKGGYLVTQFFCVGTTKVTYTLTDESGNVHQCEFDVTVNDVERPVLTCPQDIFINLNGGECGRFVSYAPVFAGDNCGVVDTTMTPPSGSYFEIGNHVVTIVITDEAGNTRTCTFNIFVIEYIPISSSLSCNDLVQVSLDATCVYTIGADEVLEGGDYHCYEDYIMNITNNQNQSIGNTFNATHIGRTFNVMVIDTETGNSCWGLIKVEDKLAPALTCPANITIACSQSIGIANTGNVGIQDCSSTTTQIGEVVNDNGECGNPRQIITRTFIVTDAWGNQSLCSHTITVVAFDLINVVFPSDITVECETAYLNPAATQPNATGRPSVSGSPIGVGGLCSASVSYTDELFDICVGSYTIHRTWKVSNECLPLGPNNPVSFTQRIRIRDNGGPAFSCPADITVSVDPFSCCATAALPDVIISEGCSNITDLKARVTGVDPNNGNITTFTVSGSLGDFPGNNYWNPDTLALFPFTQCLPNGNTYTVQYTAADQCGNTSSCTFNLLVMDLVPPAVSCDEFTQVSLGVSGRIIVNASTFDDGTYDNCCLEGFEVARMVDGPCDLDNLDDEFAPTVEFCCADLGDTVLVVFRAYDCTGNTNDCMVQVYVDDKLKPVCTPPANVTVACENFDPSLWAYGAATATDNCCMDTITTVVILTNFDTTCNKGTITRRFTAVDCAGQTSTCTQRIVVQYEQDYYVRFPNDKILFSCDSSFFDQPTFFGEDCELLAVSFNDDLFTVVPDACYKIERTWTIINWCTFNPNLDCIYVPNPNPNVNVNSAQNLPGPVVSAPGTTGPWAPTVVRINPSDPTTTNFSTFWDANANCYSYKQIIKVVDNQDPVVSNCPASPLEVCDLTPNDALFWNEMYWWDNTIGSHDLCEAPTDLTITALDSCGGENVNVRYLLFLDLDQSGDMETVISSTNLPGFNNVKFNNINTLNYTGGTDRAFDGRPVGSNQKYGFALQTTINAAAGTKTAALRWNTFQSPSTFVVPQLPYGTHKIKWFVEDGCGNETICEYEFIVKDCKAPTVVCLNGLSANIMPTDMIVLWASDFLQYTEDNCTPEDQIKIGIRRKGAGTGFPTNPDGTPQTNVMFTCADLGTQFVELWGEDAAGNADYCETYIIVQDNAGNCTNSNVTVAGDLQTEMNNGLQDAEVELNGSHPALPPINMFEQSVNDGSYMFGNALPLAANYTVTPTKDDDHLNGVSTFDLVLINKHILGIESFDSPYKIIAADANNSKSVTTFDIAEIRKLILGIYTELPNNTSWRFVNGAYVFPTPDNPFAPAFPETKSVADVQANQLGDDFVAVKLGDVNGTAIANSFMSTNDRTNGTLLFDVEDRKLKAGETVTVNFKAAEKVTGYQFTLGIAGLEVVDLIPGEGMSAENFGVFADAITTSFDANVEGAFSVTFRAKQAGSLRSMLSVSGRITQAEGYSLGGDRLNVALRFNGKDVHGVGFELYQNQPNPWMNRTVIGFHLPEATEAILNVYDESGRLLFTQTGDFAKGHNAFTLDRALVNTTGALYYQVLTSEDSATMKMIQTK